MHINDTQQKYGYHDFVQKVSSLFKKIKEDKVFSPLFDRIKEDESICNALVGFNIVRFLIERDTNWNEVDKVCQVVQKQLKKRAKQELEYEAEKVLSEYGYIEGDVEEVSIYGNHANITLADDKKEFKISEFLNGDFCEKNRISGFSTLHSDGKSGMHGFVSKEGEKKIRHYVVTDGSYEMTLKWYVKGKECEITINIDDKGVDLIKGDNFALEQLKENRDVKIGGLFLNEIKFRNREQEKEIKQSFETTTRTDAPKWHDNPIYIAPENQSEAKKKRERRQAAQRENSEGQVNNLQLPFRENARNKRTPSPISVDYQDEGQRDKQYGNPTFTTFGYTIPGSQKLDSLYESEQTPNNQQQPEIQQQEGNSGNKGTIPPVPPRTTSPKKDVSNERRDLSYDDGQKIEFKRYIQGNTLDLNELDSINLPKLLEFLEKEQSITKVHFAENADKKVIDKVGEITRIEVATYCGEQPSILCEGFNNSHMSNGSDSGVSFSTYENNEQSQIDHEQLDKSLRNAEQSKTLLTEFFDKLDKETHKFPLRPVNQEEMSKQTRERLLKDGLLKDSLADIKIVTEQENADANTTIDKDSLYKLPEEDASAEYTSRYDRNRVTLGNKGIKLSKQTQQPWTERITNEQRKKDISID